MKIYGSIKELFSAVFRKNSQQITVRPNQTTTYTADRDVQLPPQDADGVLVSANSSQALTNKTLVVASNTVTTAASGNLAATELNSALSELQGDIDTRALTGGNLSQFAATTSAQLAGVISDETGSGALVFGTSPALTTPSMSSIVNSGTLTLPTATDTLVGRATSDTLSNKTLAFLKTETESGTISAGAITLTKGFYRITGGGTTLSTVNGPSDGQSVVLFNNSGADITVDQTGNVQTGTGTNFTFKNGAATTLAYSSSATKWLLSGGAGGGGLATSLQTTTFTAAAGNHYLCSTSGGAYTATLPAGTTGSVVRFSDDARTWGTINLTLAPASGESIDGLAANETLVCDLTGAFVQLMWDGTKWVIDTNGYAAAITSGSLSSAQGMGAKNYMGNPNNSTNWVASDAGILIATESTISNLPANSTQTSGIRVTRVSGTTSYDRYRFTLDVADYGKKFAISFDQKYAGTSGDYTLAVYSNTASDYTGTSTALTLQTSSIAALNGSFNTTVDMPGSTAPYIEFRVVAVAGTTPLYLNNVYIGPGIITQGAAVSGPTTFVMSILGQSSNPTKGTITFDQANWVRVGEFMEIQYSYVATTGGAAGSGDYRLQMPTGYTINTAYLSAVDNQVSSNVGDFVMVNDVDTTPLYGTINAVSSTLMEMRAASARIGSSTGSLASANYRLGVNIRIPIAEWAGNGTVNLGAGAQVEYAFSTNTTTTAGNTQTDDGLYGNGPGGAAIVGIGSSTASSFTSKRVRFQYPIQADDLLILEVQQAVGAPWIDVTQHGLGPVTQARANFGMQVIRVSGSATDVYVRFGNSGATPYSGSAQVYETQNIDPWSNYTSYYWRVRKAKASSPVGFGMASATDSGLVTREQTETLTLNNTFTGGVITFYRVGKMVTATLTTAATWTSSAAPVTTSAVSANFRPTLAAWSLVYMTGTTVVIMTVNTSGTAGFEIRDWAGSGSAQTALSAGVTMSYVVP